MDREATQAKYAEEREKRLRPDGNDQYQRLADKFAHFEDDPYVPRRERTVKKDHVTVAFIGGGFSGLVTGARLAELGIHDVRIIEKGGDFGGTWYWNRYPGAMCDTASMIYLPLLEETGHMPTEKYARAPEILAHCERIGRQYGLYDKALFHTRVQEMSWQEQQACWRITTDRGDDFTAQFVAMGTGPLHVPKLPGLSGIENFKGHSFHTSRWDYAYTGGDAAGAPMTGLADKKVALIGTGATAVQCIPHLAAACKTFFVCQRTPSSVDFRTNEPTDPAWYAAATEDAGWQQRWMENFTENMNPLGRAEEDLVRDGWTDLARRFRERVATLPEAQRKDPLAMFKAWETADYDKMDAIRARVDEEVKDPETAASLKAWYRQLCKRPCFHDDYLDAFNNASTVLLDTDGKGVERITEAGVVVAGKEYPVDCIIYGTGFLIGTETQDRCGFEMIGRAGVTLSEYWEKGMRTLHGVSTHGFPNAFRVQPTQAANFIANVPHNIVESARTIALMIKHTLDAGYSVIETEAAAEAEWLKLLSESSLMLADPSCTPGYYNNEGQPLPEEARVYVGHPGGPMAYFRYIDEWRSNGRFDGMALR
ncbi:MAG: NAD(P)/FAD-dependent oxidoreductase [Halioglobus sp.]|nr:NAD(P)/FAD-dependent oxidoreductase [Halioglobus sp.]